MNSTSQNLKIKFTNQLQS